MSYNIDFIEYLRLSTSRKKNCHETCCHSP